MAEQPAPKNQKETSRTREHVRRAVKPVALLLGGASLAAGGYLLGARGNSEAAPSVPKEPATAAPASPSPNHIPSPTSSPEVAEKGSKPSEVLKRGTTVKCYDGMLIFKDPSPPEEAPPITAIVRPVVYKEGGHLYASTYLGSALPPDNVPHHPKQLDAEGAEARFVPREAVPRLIDCTFNGTANVTLPSGNTETVPAAADVSTPVSFSAANIVNAKAFAVTASYSFKPDSPEEFTWAKQAGFTPELTHDSRNVTPLLDEE